MQVASRIFMPFCSRLGQFYHPQKSNVLCASAYPKHAFITARSVAVEPKTGSVDVRFDVLKALGPKADVMPLARAVINRLLKADVLAPPEKVESAEGGSRVGFVGEEGPGHAARAYQTQWICLRPTHESKCSPKLPHCADQRQIHGVARQSVGGNREAGHTSALKNFQSHANGAREDDVCSKTVGHAQGQNPRDPAVHPLEDKHDQPDAEHAKAQNRQALQYAD
jgi:hypothetical protein